MLSTQTKSVRPIYKHLVEFFILGIIGYLFNLTCNWSYRKVMNEEAQLPMKIGFVATYYIAICYPLMLQLISFYTAVLNEVATTNFPVY